MLPLYDSTRRRIALATFFAVGVLPTLVVAGWAAWWRSPWHVRAEAERLEWQLGLRVSSLAAVRHPRPGVAVYEGLELCDPETDRPVFWCRAIEADGNGVAQEAAGTRPALQLTVSSPKINASAWDQLWRLLDRVLSRRAGLADRALRVTAEELAVAGLESSMKLAELRGRVETISQGMQAEAVFRMAGQTGSEPARLLVMRNRQVTPPAVAFELETRGSPLPCPLLAMGLGGFGPLGAQSTFQGTLRSVQSRDGPSGELFGEFAGVELERLVSDRLPSAISGPAEIQVKMARFHGGRLQDAAAAMAAGPGMVSRSLVEAAVQHLGLTGGVGIDRPDRLIPYEKLAAWVTCDAKGLRIQGLSPGESPRTILAGQRGPILSQSQSPATPLPLAAMARALTPEAEDLLPLARKSDDMLRRLPASEAPSPADGENSLR